MRSDQVGAQLHEVDARALRVQLGEDVPVHHEHPAVGEEDYCWGGRAVISWGTWNENPVENTPSGRRVICGRYSLEHSSCTRRG